MADVLELVILRRLESPNKTRGYHWRRRHRDTLWWQYFIRAAAKDPATLQAWNLILETATRRGRTGKTYIYDLRKKERRRVTIVRVVKTARAFIRDEDNLHFCAKPVNDALKRLGLIYDDTRTWMEQPPIEQRVADDLTDRTIVRIERLIQENTDAA